MKPEAIIRPERNYKEKLHSGCPCNLQGYRMYDIKNLILVLKQFINNDLSFDMTGHCAWVDITGIDFGPDGYRQPLQFGFEASKFPAVIGPVKKSLSLLWAA